MLLLNPAQKVLCCYTNSTSRIQILRISGMADEFFERAVMPEGTILFEAFKEARLEVHTSELMGAILSDVIPCERLIKIPENRRRESLSLPILRESA